MNSTINNLTETFNKLNSSYYDSNKTLTNILNSVCGIGNFFSGFENNGTLICSTFTEVDPIWSKNWTNMYDECPANYTQIGFYPNGTIKCRYLNYSTSGSTTVSSCKLTRRISDGYFPYGKFGCAIEFI